MLRRTSGAVPSPQEASRSRSRSRMIAGLSAPPLKRMASGRPSGWSLVDGAVAGVLAHEGGEVARHLRLAGEGQPPLLQAGARRLARRGVRRGERKEAVHHQLLHLAARQRAAENAAHHGAPAAAEADRHLVRRIVRQQHLLGAAAEAGQGVPALAVEALAEARLEPPRQRDVDVVAAEQDVVADRQAVEGQASAVAADADQAEVRGAAADVDDEDQAGLAQQVLPASLVLVDPGVERRLRLFEQDRVRQPGALGRGDAELARHLVERRRHRQDDLLLFQGRAGEALLPRLADVLQVARRRLDRRQLGDVVGRRPGQDRRLAVDAAVTEPRLRRGHQPTRHAGALGAGELADGVGAVRIPGQGERPGGDVVLAADVQERG